MVISRRKVLRDGAILAAAGVAAACAAPRQVAGTAASGSIAWEYRVDGGVRGLRYGTGTVVVDNAAVLTGLEAKSGRELWRFPIATPGIGRRSCLWNDALVVCGAEPDATGDRAVAVDLASGKRNWSFDAPDGIALGGVFGVRDRVLYLIASDRDRVGREAWAVDLESKTVRWRVPCDAEGLTVPDNGSLLYNQSPGTGGDLAALDLGTGATAWSRAGDAAVSATTIASGLVRGAVLATDGAHLVSGLDPKTGAALWTTPDLPYTAGVVFGSDDAYYLCDGTALHAMTPGSEAAKLWSIGISPQGVAADVGGYPSTGAFYLLAGRALRAVDAHTGLIRWTQSIPDKPGSQVSFAVGDTHCYVESAEDDPGASAVVAIAR